MENEDFNKYEDQIIDVDEVEGTDVKINPDYYIHNAIIKAQQALVKEDLKTGLIQYRLIIEHIETLCKAAKMLTKDYEEEIKKYQEELKKDNGEEYIKSVKLATKKLEILMSQVFSNKVATDPLHA